MSWQDDRNRPSLGMQSARSSSPAPAKRRQHAPARERKLGLPMEIRIADTRAVGRLLWVQGAELGFVSRAWLRAGDEIRIRVRQPGRPRIAQATLLVRKSELADERLLTKCTALLTEISSSDIDALSAWVQDACVLETASSQVDPQVALSADGKRLQLKWTAPEIFLRAWESDLSGGTLRVPPGLASPQGRLVLRLILPDNQILAIPGRVVQRNGRPVVDFRVQHSARRRLRAAAESYQNT